MSLARERAVDRTRKFAGRVAGPLFTPRHGWLFVSRRTAATLLQRASALGGPPEGFHTTSFAAAAARVGRTVERPEPGYPVLTLPDGIVVTPWGHAGPDPRHFIEELGFVAGHQSRALTSHLEQCELATRGAIEEVAGHSASLLQNYFTNYCHWLVQGLVRFDVLDRTGGFDRFDRILVSPGTPEIVYEAAESYGLARDRFVELPLTPGAYRCEELTVVGLPQSPTSVPRWLVDGLRDRFGRFHTAGAASAPRRIHLTRGEATRRRVVNNAELTAALERRGFVSLSMDGRSLAEQAELMGSAECVVAPHGAAMANIVFMPRDALVVELRYRNWPTDMYAHLATTAGLRYHSLFGTEPATPRWLGRPQQIDADTVADVRALERFLDEEGIR